MVCKKAQLARKYKVSEVIDSFMKISKKFKKMDSTKWRTSDGKPSKGKKDIYQMR